MSEKLSTQPYKGTRDFYPREMRLRHWFFGVIRQVLEASAFEEYNGPMLESLDLYAAKSGEEIANEQTYNFTDRAERRLAIRPEMTPTVARMVAGKMGELNFPLRWFSLPNMYRYEKPQRGRLREFWQVNVDIFGCDTFEADLECIASAIRLLRAFGADSSMFTVHINNRRFFNDAVSAIANTDSEGCRKISKVIDKRNKIPAEVYVKELENLGMNAEQIARLDGLYSAGVEEAVAVCKAEKESGKVLSIGFQPRLDENMKMIKKIVDSGVLGKVYYIQTGGGRRRGIPFPFGTTFIEKETGGIGALGDIGCYSLDMLLGAVGYPKPLTCTGYVSAFFGKNPNYAGYQAAGHPEYAEKFGVDDFAAAFVRLEGGIILDFRISWAMHMDTCGDALILGTKGGLRIPSTECWNGEFTKPLKIYKCVGGKDLEFEVPYTPSGDLFGKKIRSFVDSIKEGGKPTVPSSEIIYNQAILDAIAKSNEAGKEIEIVIPEV